jgi:pSer/pThr/pTyr-binding forkhead associated (FHA) protein
MGKLVLREADGTLRDVRLDRQRFTIGRRADNDLCLPYPAVSSEHAAIVTILSDSFLEDLESTNGTLVNGRPVTKCLLRDRDRIDIGQQELVYLADDAASLEPPATPAGEQALLPIDMDVGRATEGIASDRQAAVVARQRSAAREPGPAEVGAAAGGGVASATSSFALRVTSGAGIGRLVPLANDETVIGRAGMQVVAIRRVEGGLRVVSLEGSARPTLNGVPVPADGQRLAPGDTLEIAGTKLTLVVVPSESG